MNKTRYANNTQPKVGDVVCFESDDTGELFVVQTVQGGRLGNKVGIVSKSNPKTFSREYYYYCLCPIGETVKL